MFVDYLVNIKRKFARPNSPVKSPARPIRIFHFLLPPFSLLLPTFNFLMPKPLARKPSTPAPAGAAPATYGRLLGNIDTLLVSARHHTARVVNACMTATYWHVSVVTSSSSSNAAPTAPNTAIT